MNCQEMIININHYLITIITKMDTIHIQITDIKETINNMEEEAIQIWVMEVLILIQA